MASVNELLPFTRTMAALGQYIMYYPIIAHALGGVKVAVFIGPFMYFEGKQNDTEGWIYKTASEIENQTGLTRTEQENARKTLRELGVLDEARRGVPARLFYRFDWGAIDKLIYSYLEKIGEKPKQAKQPKAPKQAKVVELKPEVLTENQIQEPKPDPLLYRAKVVFSEFYKQQTDNEYVWSEAKGGGNDWRSLKGLCEKLRKALISYKKRKNQPPESTENKDQQTVSIEITDDEIIDNLNFFLSLLPEWYRKNGLAPATLNNKYNEIIASIKTSNKKPDTSGKGDVNSRTTAKYG